ncbi:MAG: hypothetical protein M1828_003892 [Chrysothrix sp. TS-e1954]|nr:MAG: hypothetical protein M1828_003892 [Chrysothrix sp. TS-e1954]
MHDEDQNQGQGINVKSNDADQPKDESSDDPHNSQINNVTAKSQGTGAHHDEADEPKHHKKSHTTREVTDPVTHLPIKIRDFTEADLKNSKDDAAAPDSAGARSASVASSKTQQSHGHAQASGQKAHEGLEQALPMPAYVDAQPEIARLLFKAMAASAVLISSTSLLSYFLMSWVFQIERVHMSTTLRYIAVAFCSILDVAVAIFILWSAAQWTQKKTKHLWDGEVSHTQKKDMDRQLAQEPSETVLWLNRLIGTIWPLVNPDLFISMADMLEDVMQASLPRFVRMVSVEDIGQGSEAVRILGIKIIPKGAANEDVAEDDPPKHDQSDMEGKAGAGQTDQNGNEQAGHSRDTKQEGHEDTQESDEGTSGSGMEAEQGEFVNVEIAFAYHANRQLKRFRDRAKNFHMLLAFYLPGHLKIPVWLELRGVVGTVRARLQLTSDPPFVTLCTMTFLGQPKVDISCVPLLKKGPNIMDLPFISNFVQSSIDAATAESVAPKSNIFDLQAMLSGDGIKKDTASRGIVVIRIHRAFDFKPGDTGIPVLSSSSSDPYVSVGWAKFGKPEWSSRVIVGEMHPYWEEQTALLVGPEELAADESLRVILWDSDRLTADDDLGRIELNLKQLMRNQQSDGKMWDRVDGFRALSAGEAMPGKLSWSVGYFSKTRLQDSQVQRQYNSDTINTVDELRNEVFKQAGRKLREAATDETEEVEQLKEQDFENTQAEVVSDSPPLEEYPSGILSIQIHQILGLQLEDISGHASNDREQDQLEGHQSDLPNSYCTVTLNHQRIYKTRVKPQNAQPFFNAGTERFVRDWRTASLFIAARDARVHEDDALLGFVNLPLAQLFRSRKASRLNGSFPLAGGIGYGRVKISLVFRSVQMQGLTKELGWDWGTLRIAPEVTASENLPKGLQAHRIKFRTSLGRVKMHSSSHKDHDVHDSSTDIVAKWTAKHDQPLMLPVRRRYAANMTIEFRTSSAILKDKTPAWAVLWLKDIPDQEEMTLSVPVFKGNLARARTNVLPEEECGERLGVLNIKLCFLRGLSKYHRGIAKKDPDVANVMEVLSSARDNGELDGVTGDATSDVDDSDSSESEDERKENRDPATSGGARHRAASSKRHHHGGQDGTDSSDDDGVKEEQEGGLLNDIKGYKRHSGQLHRTHRGIMQWKAPRTLKWMKHKAEGVAEDVGSLGRHKERQPGVETEV